MSAPGRQLPFVVAENGTWRRPFPKVRRPTPTLRLRITLRINGPTLLSDCMRVSARLSLHHNSAASLDDLPGYPSRIFTCKKRND